MATIDPPTDGSSTGSPRGHDPAPAGDAAVSTDRGAVAGDGPRVRTSRGVLRGLERDGVLRFAGIPYAQAPTADLRFRPPVPVDPWHGEREALEPGPIAAQNPDMLEMLFGGATETWGEDCLYLNVWTPTVDPAEPLPVMVWIHGGAFEMGSGSSPLYDGTPFARNAVVIVTLNYRLGAFGFLELGHLDPTLIGSGNVGLLDQVAALEWVREEISAFGGDPSRVTVFGESAGAMSIAALLAMPRARGLFHAAILQSGAASACRSIELARADTEEFMQRAGLSSIDDLRAAAPETLLAAHAAMGAARVGDPDTVLGRTGDPMSFLSFRPVADGEIVPVDPLGAIRGGAAAGVRLLVGTNRDEWKLFTLITASSTSVEHLRDRLGLAVADPDALLEVHQQRLGADAPITELENAALTDLVFRTPADRLIDAQSAHAPVFQYRFDWPSPAFGGALGAAHAIEVPFVFDMVRDHRLHVALGPDAPTELSRAVHDAWVSFARDGVPAADALPTWPPVTADGSGGDRPVMILDTPPRLEADPDGASREFWASSAARPVR